MTNFNLLLSSLWIEDNSMSNLELIGNNTVLCSILGLEIKCY